MTRSVSLILVNGLSSVSLTLVKRLIAGVNNTGNKHEVVNIFANFHIKEIYQK
jgi:hypothetical protein